MSKTLVSHVPAKDLMADDAFKMAGQMYCITNVRKNDFGDRIVTFYPLTGFHHPIKDQHMLIVPKRTMFKVYNRQ